MRLHRRQWLKALGLGAISNFALRNRVAFADPPISPSRIVFFIQPHGHIPSAWNMAIPGAPTDQFAERALADLAPEDFSEVLRPLYPYRDRLLAIEGLSHTTMLADIAQVMRNGGDLNNHSISVADLLTGTFAAQTMDVPCTGGARSIDQEIAIRTSAPGRFGSRVYGSDYVPNSTVAPFSFLGPRQASPVVGSPATAFADLMGYYMPPTGMPQTRDDLLASLRPSVLDAAGDEYRALGSRLDADGRQRLESHRSLIRDLELSLQAPSMAACDMTLDATVQNVRQFMQIIRMAFACDLTRVVTYVAPVPQCPEFGYPADSTVHGTYAHASIRGATSCGAMFTPTAERAMIDLGVWYAGHFAYLLQQLNSIVEGSGTLLDHTAVVWLTEVATPTHQHHDAPIVVAGGCNEFFNLGRYVRYNRSAVNPIANFPLVGPAHNRLYASLLQAMGQSDDSFGMTAATGSDGSMLSFRGALTELHRA